MDTHILVKNWLKIIQHSTTTKKKKIHETKSKSTGKPLPATHGQNFLNWLKKQDSLFKKEKQI